MAERIERRMRELALTTALLSKKTGVSTRTIAKVLNGGTISRVDKRGDLAAGLGWKADAFDRIERGEEPIPLDAEPRPAATGEVDIAKTLAEILDAINELQRRFPS